MRFACLALVLAAALILGFKPTAQAGPVNSQIPNSVNLTAGGLTPLLDGRAAVLGPGHVLFIVTKVGAPGKRAPAGKYKIADGTVVTVNGDGVVTDPKLWNLFAPSKSIPQLYYGH
jgi:hypothetical protein